MSISVNLFLDTRDAKTACKKNPEIRFEAVDCPVKISITKDSSTTYLPTGIKVRPVHWRNRQVVGRSDKVRLNIHLQNQLAKVNTIILECKEPCRYVEMSVTDIKKDVEKRLIKGGEKKSSSPLFLPYFEAFAEKRKAKRTKEIYLATAQKIRKLLHNVQGLTLEDITLDWLEDLEDILITEGNKPSTRSIDFRNIRAVINDAKKHKLIRDYPFEGFTMPIGESSDRALTIEQLKAFIHAELKPWEEKYRDFFLLSFLLIGINTEDLLHIRTISDDGRINYVRAKTHKEMSVLVEPEALKIIERYRGKSGFLLNVLDSYSNTHNWTSRVDKNLREMSNRIGLPEITMYWARHTWATLAHIDLGIELSTISDAFGHQPEKRVTLIYIKRKDYAKVDEANRKVIDYCFAPDDRVI